MFQISPEQWMRSAAHVSGQGEELAAGHLLSDKRIEAAQSGWQGASALAINAKMADWLKKSTALVIGIGSHAYGLQEAAIQHAAAEEERARALASVGAAADITVSSNKV
ncbi:WXG100 family type VII secretion target [Mycobacterium riyadhense]|uniref:WXG100 family type VII secretion target n=1 Tax=Mycobacterium riyadhense TaxID=486698 RepID=UPI0019591B08|nr:WXG100 family type VII secretion target [Mycobacterium riyadhense]